MKLLLRSQVIEVPDEYADSLLGDGCESACRS